MGFLASLVDNFQDHLERKRNRPFLTSTMAACALVAMANGRISFAQRVRVDQILEALTQLNVFDPHEGINIFNAFTDDIMAHPEAGHDRAWQALVEGAPSAECRDLLVRICLAVSEMNGEANLADQIEIVSICNRLGVDPANMGLYIDDPGFSGTQA